MLRPAYPLEDIQPSTSPKCTTIRDHVLAPLLGAINTPRVPTKTNTWTNIEHDYEALRTDMQTLFADLGIAA